MTVKAAGHHTINYTINWPHCLYCNSDALPVWYEDGTQWLCMYHRKLRESGWLDLVQLVDEAVSG